MKHCSVFGGVLNWMQGEVCQGWLSETSLILADKKAAIFKHTG
jgi:hypothetical protein